MGDASLELYGAAEPVAAGVLAYQDEMVRKFLALDSLYGEAGLSDPDSLAALVLPAGVGDYAAELARTGTLEAAVRGVNPSSTSVEFASALRAVRAELCSTGSEALAGLRLVAALFEVHGCPRRSIELWVSAFDEPMGSSAAAVPLREMTTPVLSKRADDEARARLGRWWERNNTRARRYYLAPGSPALDRKRRETVLGIYRQRQENLFTAACALVFFAAMCAFVWAYPEGLLFGRYRAGFGVGVLVVGTGVLTACIAYVLRNPFNGLNGLVGVLFALWCVYAGAVALG